MTRGNLQSGTTVGENEAREHLEKIATLSREIVEAIQAIERNDVNRLCALVEGQEKICNQLSESRLLLEPPKGEQNSGITSNIPLRDEIREAYVALAQLNRTYSALLRRTERSCGLLQSLYRGLQGYSSNGPTLPQSSKLSCEV